RGVLHSVHLCATVLRIKVLESIYIQDVCLRAQVQRPHIPGFHCKVEASSRGQARPSPILGRRVSQSNDHCGLHCFLWLTLCLQTDAFSSCNNHLPVVFLIIYTKLCTRIHTHTPTYPFCIVSLHICLYYFCSN